MKTSILQYPVVIEPDTDTGSKKPGFTAYCPSLGIADDGNSIDEALSNLKNTIEFHLACLKAEGESIPQPSLNGIFTSIQVAFP